MSSYVRVLNDPFQMSPVRLGGETVVETALATLTGRFRYVIPASGASSFVIYPRGVSPIQWSSSAAGPYVYAPSADLPQYAGLSALASGGRVVAAGARIFSVASADNDNGLVVAGLIPRPAGNIVPTASGPYSYVISNGSGASFPFYSPGPNIPPTGNGVNEFMNYVTAETYPLKSGLTMVYAPQDPSSFIFKSILGRGAITLPVLPGGGGLWPNEDYVDPFFIVGISGAAASSTITIELTVHIEYTVGEFYQGVVATQTGNMSSVQSFHAAKSLMDSTESKTRIGIQDGGLFPSLGAGLKTIARGALGASSGLLFGSTNLGTGLADVLGL